MNKKATAVLLLLFLVGCNPFAPELIESGPQSAIITGQRTPDEVLTNFRFAYVLQDSLVYSDLLDSSFIFISKNYGSTPPTDINWGRDVDIRATVGLFRNFDVLELNWGGKLSEGFGADSTLYEIKITFQLGFISSVESVPTIKGEAFFNFKRNPSGIWKITRWEDLSSF
jgi:hypothetical protein